MFLSRGSGQKGLRRSGWQQSWHSPARRYTNVVPEGNAKVGGRSQCSSKVISWRGRMRFAFDGSSPQSAPKVVAGASLNRGWHTIPTRLDCVHVGTNCAVSRARFRFLNPQALG